MSAGTVTVGAVLSTFTAYDALPMTPARSVHDALSVIAPSPLDVLLVVQSAGSIPAPVSDQFQVTTTSVLFQPFTFAGAPASARQRPRSPRGPRSTACWRPPGPRTRLRRRVRTGRNRPSHGMVATYRPLISIWPLVQASFTLFGVTACHERPVRVDGHDAVGDDLAADGHHEDHARLHPRGSGHDHDHVATLDRRLHGTARDPDDVVPGVADDPEVDEHDRRERGDDRHVDGGNEKPPDATTSRPGRAPGEPRRPRPGRGSDSRPGCRSSTPASHEMERAAAMSVRVEGARAR